MKNQDTVILAVNNGTLLRDIEAIRPDLNAVTVGKTIPDITTRGRIWCFVDWVLQECSGLEMCHKLRTSTATADSHIMMVMETRNSDAQRRAIRSGADSYIVGPITAELLIRKIDTYIIQRPYSKPETKLTHGDLVVDLNAYRVQYMGRNIALPPNEFRVLTHFIENPDRLLTRKNLIEMLGKSEIAIDERIVNVWVRRLRQTLSHHQVPDPVRTVRSQGYVLDSIG